MADDDDEVTSQPTSGPEPTTTGRAPPLRGRPQPQVGAPSSDPHGQWLDWLGKPDNRAALISFGASMLQPTYMGLGSQVGASLGAAAQTLDTRQKQAMAEEKQASDIDVAQRGAAVRESEAETYKRAQSEGARENKNRLSWYMRYQADQRAIDKFNSDLDKDLLKSPEDKERLRKPALPSFEEYYLGKQAAAEAAARAPLKMFDRNSPEYAKLAEIMRNPQTRQAHLDKVRAANPAAADALEKEFPKLR